MVSYNRCAYFRATNGGGKTLINECKACVFFNNCLDDMGRDMEEDMNTVVGKYIKEMREVVREHIKEYLEQQRKVGENK